MALFPSFIPWSNQRQTIPYLFLGTENPPIPANTYNGVVITICLLSIVSSVLLPTGQKTFVLCQSSLTRSYNNLGRLCTNVNTLYGL